MKKIKLLIAVVLCFLVVGCSCEKKDKEGNEKPKGDTQIESTIKSMYTDDKKLVFDNNGIYKLVFYYSGNEITGLEHYYEYKDEKEAESKYKEDSENLKNNLSIKKISRNGKYVIYTMAGKEYEGKTVKQVKESYSYLLPVYEN